MKFEKSMFSEIEGNALLKNKKYKIKISLPDLFRILSLMRIIVFFIWPLSGHGSGPFLSCSEQPE